MLTAFTILFAQQEPQQPGPISWAMPLLMVVLFYFMLIRPQRRAQKEHAARLASLRSGDEVVAAGGIHGTITNLNDRTVTLKIADGVKIKVDRTSVTSISSKTDEPEAAEVEVVS